MPRSKPSIGSARMLPSGVIEMQLRAQGSGSIGDSVLVYKPSHPSYTEIVDHLGGLEPGEEKPVPPFE